MLLAVPSAPMHWLWTKPQSRTVRVPLLKMPPPKASTTAPRLAPGTPTDEVHHVLADGTVLHVSLWFRPTSSAADRIVCEPVNVGFLQMLAGSSPGK